MLGSIVKVKAGSPSAGLTTLAVCRTGVGSTAVAIGDKWVQIEEDRFGVESEMVAKIAKLRCRIFEVGISYYGRTYEEGKKIGWRDGFRALYAIIKYGCRR